MNLVRVSPWHEWQGVQRGVDRFFDHAFSRLFRDGMGSETDVAWTPRVDVHETEKELVFRYELPGFGRDEIEVTVEDGLLSVDAKRNSKREEGLKYHLVECTQQKFHRSFLIPSSADGEKVSANLKDGVLTVTLPKKEEAKPKQIPVSTK